MLEQHPITAPQFVRQHILRMSVVEFGELIGVSDSRVSQYEARGWLPAEHEETVYEHCRKKGIRLLRGWFKEVPFVEGVPRG